ncbi:M50 family metallopeptidase [Egibacter rhizosphaerae]|uniref:M50 family metallopeptidase n=1 Tax=Egibacter rhizosphaerae TaxID=1670831 RepID=UPI0013F157AC|nr:site-2 protease family protein [Egibacter rhizosphaerae]
MIYIAIFIAVLVLSIVIHEAGHFSTARLFGMKAERFFFGFGPTLWSVWRGETEYGVKAIPAGGFVRIAGMNKHDPVAPGDEHRAFHRFPAWQRLVVLAAGSFTHFVIAFVLIVFVLAAFPIPSLADSQDPQPVVGAVEEGSAAEEAGLEVDDELLAVEGEPLDSPEEVVEAIEPHAGEAITITFARDGEVGETVARLPETDPDGEDSGFLGIGIGVAQPDVREPSGLGAAVADAFRGEYSLWSQTALTVQGLVEAFSPDTLRSWVQQAEPGAERTAEGPVSLVGAGQLAGALGGLGELGPLFLLLVQLNIVIGIINMAPLPPFDGGHVAQVLIEAAVNGVRRLAGLAPDWELSPSVMTPLALLVLVLIGGFVLTAFYIDIVNPVSNLFQ